MRFFAPFPTALVIAAALAGCQKEEHDASSEPAASIDKTATLDPAVAKAVAAASAAAPGKTAPTGSGEPPPNGVFPPGAADREIAKGAPPKLTLGGQGTEPRVALGPRQPKPGWKATGTVEVVMQNGRQGALPVTLALSLEAQKPKAASEPDAHTDAAQANTVAVIAKVTGARVGITGVPQELEARFAKLKGARVEYLVAADGSGTGYRYELPAGAGDARDQLRILSDALALVSLPIPPQPMGVGGFWMATSREGVFGLDLVTYRLVKVEEVKGGTVTLSVNTRRYATSNHFDMEGLDPNAPRDLAEFEAKSQGRVEIVAGTPIPVSGEVESVLAAALGTANKQQGVLQIQSRVGLDFRPH